MTHTARVTEYSRCNSTQYADIYTVELTGPDGVEAITVERYDDTTDYTDENGLDAYNSLDADMLDALDEAMAEFEDRLRDEYHKANIWHLMTLAETAALAVINENWHHRTDDKGN